MLTIVCPPASNSDKFKGKSGKNGPILKVEEFYKDVRGRTRGENGCQCSKCNMGKAIRSSLLYAALLTIRNQKSKKKKKKKFHWILAHMGHY